MLPSSGTVSASSLATYEECPQKYAATYIDRLDGGSSVPADTGTTCHYALEHHVHDVYIAKTHEWDDLANLLKHYDDGYVLTFKTRNKDTDAYKDGLSLVKAWHKRTDLSKVTVLTTEQKVRTSTQVPLPETIIDYKTGDPIIEMLLTYIFDRCDYFVKDDGTKVVRVVDYKSVQAMWTYDDIEEKIQTKIYGLAAFIQYKDWAPDEVQVVMDLLRHDRCVGVSFTRDEVIATWTYLQETVRDILAMRREDAPYRVGDGCRYCPIKVSCPALNANIDGGGIQSLITIDQLIDARYRLDGQAKGLAQLVREIDSAIMRHAKETKATSFEAAGLKVQITAKGMRQITDTEKVAKIIGPDKMARIGKVGVGEIDKLIKDDMLTDEQKGEIKSLITKEYGKPSVSIKPPPPIKD